MNVTLEINGRDFSPRLSTYNPYKEVSYGRVITTLAGREIPCSKSVRQMIEFSLIPTDYATADMDYAALCGNELVVTYTDPDQNGARQTKLFRLVSNVDSRYGIHSVNGKDYYKRGKFTLRAIYAG